MAEYDAATGNAIAGTVVRTKSEAPITREAVFDINADTVASLIPSAAGNVNLVS